MRLLQTIWMFDMILLMRFCRYPGGAVCSSLRPGLARPSSPLPPLSTLPARSPAPGSRNTHSIVLIVNTIGSVCSLKT